MNAPDIFKKQKITASLALLILTVVIVGSAVGFKDKSTDTQMTADTTSATPAASNGTSTGTSTAAADTSNTSMYKNGTYTASGMYNSPGGEETLGVTLTLSNGKVTASSLKSGSNESISAGYQQDFIGGYKKYVIGKPIETIKVGHVAGSSLTSIGFNEALQTIEQQAHV